jgi:hypothetical protein
MSAEASHPYALCPKLEATIARRAPFLFHNTPPHIARKHTTYPKWICEASVHPLTLSP